MHATGGRIKIGFETCLKLLRMGATVHVTTRFPYDASQRYAGAHDFDVWKHRLHIHALDFRHIKAVEHFCDALAETLPRCVPKQAKTNLESNLKRNLKSNLKSYLKSYLKGNPNLHSRLDMIINNACQTVRRPAIHYQHLVDLQPQAIAMLPAQVWQLNKY